ncbi:pli1 [Candida margitis]|uniref:pli1 n=1 Tax=Candida margitis TaxID=1775924 RepID=UPI002226723C|nr:pli1 [Candida margitis]KAI5961797.1 pli1 [Candida margitis]
MSSYIRFSSEDYENTKRRINQLKVSELKSVCRSLGVIVGGRKDELIQRIICYFKVGRDVNDTIRLNAVRDLVFGIKDNEALPNYNDLYHYYESRSIPHAMTPHVPSSEGLHSQDSVPVRDHHINFINNPFFRLIRQVHVSPGVCPPKESKGECRINFVFNTEEYNTLKRKDPSIRIYLLCGRKMSKGRTSDDVEIEYPIPHGLLVNGEKLLNNNYQGIRHKSGTAKPVDLTDYLLSPPKSNRIRLYYTDKEETYYVYLYFVRVIPFEAVINKILSNPKILKSHTIRHIKGNTDDSHSDGIEIQDTLLTLRDPYTYTRIKTPVKTLKCKHLECFDVRIFMTQQYESPTWECPYCSCPLDVSELAVCEYFEEILKNTGPEDVYVKIAKDGKWSPYVEEEDPRIKVKAEDRDRHSVVHDVVTLSSDEEDEDLEIPRVTTTTTTSIGASPSPSGHAEVTPAPTPDAFHNAAGNGPTIASNVQPCVAVNGSSTSTSGIKPQDNPDATVGVTQHVDRVVSSAPINTSHTTNGQVTVEVSHSPSSASEQIQNHQLQQRQQQQQQHNIQNITDRNAFVPDQQQLEQHIRQLVQQQLQMQSQGQQQLPSSQVSLGQSQQRLHTRSSLQPVPHNSHLLTQQQTTASQGSAQTLPPQEQYQRFAQTRGALHQPHIIENNIGNQASIPYRSSESGQPSLGEKNKISTTKLPESGLQGQPANLTPLSLLDAFKGVSEQRPSERKDQHKDKSLSKQNAEHGDIDKQGDNQKNSINNTDQFLGSLGLLPNLNQDENAGLKNDQAISGGKEKPCLQNDNKESGTISNEVPTEVSKNNANKSIPASTLREISENKKENNEGGETNLSEQPKPQSADSYSNIDLTDPRVQVKKGQPEIPTEEYKQPVENIDSDTEKFFVEELTPMEIDDEENQNARSTSTDDRNEEQTSISEDETGTTNRATIQPRVSSEVLQAEAVAPLSQSANQSPFASTHKPQHPLTSTVLQESHIASRKYQTESGPSNSLPQMYDRAVFAAVREQLDQHLMKFDRDTQAILQLVMRKYTLTPPQEKAVLDQVRGNREKERQVATIDFVRSCIDQVKRRFRYNVGSEQDMSQRQVHPSRQSQEVPRYINGSASLINTPSIQGVKSVNYHGGIQSSTQIGTSPTIEQVPKPNHVPIAPAPASINANRQDTFSLFSRHQPNVYGQSRGVRNAAQQQTVNPTRNVNLGSQNLHEGVGYATDPCQSLMNPRYQWQYRRNNPLTSGPIPSPSSTSQSLLAMNHSPFTKSLSANTPTSTPPTNQLQKGQFKIDDSFFVDDSSPSNFVIPADDMTEDSTVLQSDGDSLVKETATRKSTTESSGGSHESSKKEQLLFGEMETWPTEKQKLMDILDCKLGSGKLMSKFSSYQELTPGPEEMKPEEIKRLGDAWAKDLKERERRIEEMVSFGSSTDPIVLDSSDDE